MKTKVGENYVIIMIESIYWQPKKELKTEAFKSKEQRIFKDTSRSTQ